MSWQDYCILEVGGERVGCGDWFMSSEEDSRDPEILVWYSSNCGVQFGTQLGACKLIDPVYGEVT